MQIKRLTNEELTEKCMEVFYDYMSNEGCYYTDEDGIKKVPCLDEYPTPMHMVYKEHLNSIKENEERIKLFKDTLEQVKGNKNCEEVLTKQLEYLNEEREIFLTTNMKNQKALYKKTKKIDYTRNCVRIPLDKKINSFYDDFCLDVAFYDDIGVVNGVYDTFKTLETAESRRNFIVKNTKVTHMGLVFLKNGRHIATISLLGNLNTKDRRVQEANITLLGKEFSDFYNLTLKDTIQIRNNDLKQFLQSKIDMDKVEMPLLCDKNVGNDNYKIFRNPEYIEQEWEDSGNPKYYIRYVCPSTGRVYYNAINMRNLAMSEYFNEGSYDSYVDAWWSITHVGANPNSKAIIRC